MLVLVFLLVGCEEQIRWALPPGLRFGEDRYKPFYENRGKIVYNDEEFKIVGKLNNIIHSDKETDRDDVDDEYNRLLNQGVDKPIILYFFSEDYDSFVGGDVYQGVGEKSKYLIIKENVTGDPKFEVFEYIEPPKD